MTINTSLAGSLKMMHDIFKMSVADLSDADLMQRPVAGANHPNWQIGHLILAESNLMSAVGAKMPELPAGFKERYAKETHSIDDPTKFANKADLLALYDKVRASTIEFAKSAPAAKFDEKGPIDMLPTVGDTVALHASHTGMHLGQIQVLRRKLGKPILF